MGRRGPSPEPTALKVLKGNPGRRPLNDREPRSKSERPRCPTWLDKEAKSVWKKIVPKLEAMGVFAEIDGQALTRYCTAWAQWKRSIEFIQNRGDTFAIKDDKGGIRYLQQLPTSLHRQQAGHPVDTSGAGVRNDTERADADSDRAARAG